MYDTKKRKTRKPDERTGSVRKCGFKVVYKVIMKFDFKK